MSGARVHELHCRPPGAQATRIRIGRGLRAGLVELLGAPGTATLTVAEDAVLDLWPEFRQLTLLLPHPGGEAHKTMAGLEALLRELARRGIDRNGRLVAVGGGALGDLAGLAGALWLRGIEVWQIPTTLLAMVDAAVGGKTAVDLPEGKNLVGAVHPPAEVWIDPELLGSLPDVQFRSGLAEVLKMAIGLDRELFALLEDHAEKILARTPGPLDEAIHRAVAGKAEVVAGDLGEAGPRRTLNLGHTVGHALEAHSGNTTPHGLCVAQGLHRALELAASRGLLEPADRARATALLERYGFALEPLPVWSELVPFLQRDKKVNGDVLYWVLPTGIGTCTTVALPTAALAGGMAGLAEA